jgi:hypothetical protein
MNLRFNVFLINTAAFLLLAVGLAKALSGQSNEKVFSLVDPIVGIPLGRVILIVSIVEVLVAIFCFSRHVPTKIKLSVLAGISLGFLGYRLGLWFIEWKHLCNCMGSLAGALHITDVTADNIMKCIPAYLLLGSFGLLLIRRQRIVYTSTQNLPAAAGVETR